MFQSHMITLVADQDGTCLSADGQQVLVAVSEDGQEITLRGSLSDDEGRCPDPHSSLSLDKTCSV